jgi:hypothetical protein
MRKDIQNKKNNVLRNVILVSKEFLQYFDSE